jgi:hypothetical protein
MLFFLDSQGEFIYNPSHKKQRLITSHITHIWEVAKAPGLSIKSRVRITLADFHFLLYG